MFVVVCVVHASMLPMNEIEPYMLASFGAGFFVLTESVYVKIAFSFLALLCVNHRKR